MYDLSHGLWQLLIKAVSDHTLGYNSISSDGGNGLMTDGVCVNKVTRQYILKLCSMFLHEVNTELKSQIASSSPGPKADQPE